MAEKYCCQLKGLPKTREDIIDSDLYMCKITGRRCIASNYEDPDPGHPASSGRVASYNDDLAEIDCPVYNAPNDLADQINQFRLRAEKTKLENQIKEIDSKLE